MSRNLARPYFSVPPMQYSARYFHDVIRSFSVYLEQVQNPGEGRYTNVVLTEVPDSDIGIAPGTLFHNEGVLHVSLTHFARPLGVSATGTVGSVTTTIT